MPQVGASLNLSLHTSIGYILHFIVFSQDKQLPYSVLIPKGEPIYKFDDYVRVRVADFQQIYKRVTHNIEISKEKLNAKQLRTAGGKHIGIGDVYMQVQDIATKLDSCFEGPYRVIGIEHDNKLKIRHLKNLSVKIVHIDQLKWVSRGTDSGEKLQTLSPPESTTKSLQSTSTEHRQKLRSPKQVAERLAIAHV